MLTPSGVLYKGFISTILFDPTKIHPTEEETDAQSGKKAATVAHLGEVEPLAGWWHRTNTPIALLKSGKQRLREVNSLPPGHTAGQVCASPGAVTPVTVFLAGPQLADSSRSPREVQLV